MTVAEKTHDFGEWNRRLRATRRH